MNIKAKLNVTRTHNHNAKPAHLAHTMSVRVQNKPETNRLQYLQQRDETKTTASENQNEMPAAAIILAKTKRNKIKNNESEIVKNETKRNGTSLHF